MLSWGKQAPGRYRRDRFNARTVCTAKLGTYSQKRDRSKSELSGRWPLELTGCSEPCVEKISSWSVLWDMIASQFW